MNTPILSEQEQLRLDKEALNRVVGKGDPGTIIRRFEAAKSAIEGERQGVRGLEAAFCNTPTVTNVTRSAEEVLAVRGDLPTQPVELSSNVLRRVDVKFYFTNPNHVPREIPIRQTDGDKRSGEHSASLMYAVGRQDLAEFERHRRGAFDTGEPVVKDLKGVQVATLRKGFSNIGMLLTGCFCYRQQKQGQQPKWVVVLRFGWEQPTNEFALKTKEALEVAKKAVAESEVLAAKSQDDKSRETWLAHKKAYDKARQANEAATEAVKCMQEHYKPGSLQFTDRTTEMLRSLATTTWGACHVWKNPDLSVTINMMVRSPNRAPDFALAVRERKLAVLDVGENVTEDQE